MSNNKQRERIDDCNLDKKMKLETVFFNARFIELLKQIPRFSFLDINYFNSDGLDSRFRW